MLSVLSYLPVLSMLIVSVDESIYVYKSWTCNPIGLIPIYLTLFVKLIYAILSHYSYLCSFQTLPHGKMGWIRRDTRRTKMQWKLVWRLRTWADQLSPTISPQENFREGVVMMLFQRCNILTMQYGLDQYMFHTILSMLGT